MRPKACHGRKQLSFSEKIANFAVYVYRHIHFMGQRYGGIPPAPPPNTRPRTLMTYTVWGLLFLMGVEVGGNPTLMQALDRLGWEALILTLCTALGCALAAAALWSESRRTTPATQTPTVEKDAGKELLSHKHRLVALWHQLAGSFTIRSVFRASDVP